MLVRRILYVHHGKGIGGAPLSLLYLIRGLDRTRYQPTVLCLHESEATDLFRNAGIETVVENSMHDFSHTNVLWYPWWQAPKLFLRAAQLLPTYLRARRFLRTGDYDAVHLNTSTLTAIGMAARDEGLHVVWHIREPLQRGYVGLRRAIIRRIIDRNADLILPICHYDAGELQPSPNIHVVYNFIDFAQFDASLDGASVRGELQIGNNQPVVTMLGGVNPIKGTREFVDAALRVHNDHPNAVFLIAGPLPDDSWRNRINGMRVYRESVFSRLPQTHADFIRFIGVRNDIPQLLAASDILCFPSTVPHFARPVIEASAMGVAAIASDLGGPRELLRHGETGLLVPPSEPAALADAIRRVISDPALRREMGRHGIAFARKLFDAEKNVATVIDLYDRMFEDDNSRQQPDD